jgi:hypothetical protein
MIRSAGYLLCAKRHASQLEQRVDLTTTAFYNDAASRAIFRLPVRGSWQQAKGD